MILKLTITATKAGIHCATEPIEDVGDMTPAEINLMAVGALEVAKASLLATRWGVNISGMKELPALVKQPSKRKAKTP